jgi:hypothetical protein
MLALGVPSLSTACDIPDAIAIGRSPFDPGTRAAIDAYRQAQAIAAGKELASTAAELGALAGDLSVAGRERLTGEDFGASDRIGARIAGAAGYLSNLPVNLIDDLVDLEMRIETARASGDPEAIGRATAPVALAGISTAAGGAGLVRAGMNGMRRAAAQTALDEGRAPATIIEGGDAQPTGSYGQPQIDLDGTSVSGVAESASSPSQPLLALPAPRTAAQWRRGPGLATGGSRAPVVDGASWFAGTDRNVGRVPRQVADQLRGREFSSFDELREEFWRLVAKTPELAQAFSRRDLARMVEGNAPFAPSSQSVGNQRTMQIHHRQPISQGGSVYDLDNLLIVTPRYHREVLDPVYHRGR